MDERITYIGLDVHKETIAVALAVHHAAITVLRARQGGSASGRITMFDPAAKLRIRLHATGSGIHARTLWAGAIVGALVLGCSQSCGTSDSIALPSAAVPDSARAM